VKDIFEDSRVLKPYAKSVDLQILDHDNGTSPEASPLTKMEVARKKQPIMGPVAPEATGLSIDENSSKMISSDDKAPEKDATEMAYGDASILQSPIKEQSAFSESLGEERYQDCESPSSKIGLQETHSSSLPPAKQTLEGKIPEFDPPTNSLVHEAIANGVWGLNPSDLIRDDHERECTGLPNCTASHRATPNWRITASMLSAYTAMRGPYRNTGRDVFVWMDRCGKSFETQDEGNDQVGSCNS
jgi:hypothetical protein